MKTLPIVALLAGVPPAAVPCNCGLHRGRRLGFILQPQPGDDAPGDYAPDYEPDYAPEATPFDWHWLAIGALSLVTLYALFPKPARERRNVQRREAAAAYHKRLREISRPKKAAR